MTFANILISAALLLAVIMIAITANDRIGNQLLGNRRKFAAESIAVEIAFGLRKPEIYRRIVDDSGGGTCNATFNCVRTNTDCSTLPGGITAFHPVTCLYAIDNPTLRIFDDSNVTQGFDLDGRPCNTFSDLNPDGNCLFRPTVTWRPLCTRTPCINSPVEFFVDVRMPSSSPVPLNSAQRRLRVVAY